MEDNNDFPPQHESERPARKKTRLQRVNTPHLMAVYLERLMHEIRADTTGSIFEKGTVIVRIMRLLRDIHADEVLAKRQDEQEERLLRLQERVKELQKRGMLQ